MRISRYFRAECVKLLTRPSIPLTVAGVLAAGVGIAWLETPSVLQAMLSGSPDLAAGTGFESMGFDMVSACQLGMVAVGAMTASGEYRRGGLRESLLAMPARLPLLAAQALALALFCTIAAAISVPAISLVAQARLSAHSIVGAGIPPDLALDWAGAVLFWVASALVTFFLVHVFRSVVVPLFAMVCLSLTTYVALSLTSLARFLPTTAGILLFDPLSITASYPDAALSRPQAALVVVVWAVAAGCLAAALFARRPGR